MATEKARKLGKLSLAILENFVEGHLGPSFVKGLREPYDQAALITSILAKTEERFVSSHADKDLSKTMFVDLSQKDRPELTEAIKRFYQDPTRDTEFNRELCHILFHEFGFLPQERVEKAIQFYLDILIEELAMQDQAFREKVQFISHYRHSNMGNNKEKIRRVLYDDSDLIEEKSREFVGRENIFDAVDDFIGSNTRGYFLIKGEPGIGKTSFMSSLTKQKKWIHHFNSLTEGRNTPQKFYENICAQLILQYSLDYDELPEGATGDARFLSVLLKESIQKGGPGTKIIIAVDAMDEVRHPELAHGASVLFLPRVLPRNVFIVFTSRDDPRFHIECEYGIFEIDKKSEENQRDIETYLLMKTESEGIRRYLNTQHLEKSQFIHIMRDKSEGNFMYLRYVLPELEHLSGAYNNLDVMALPQGLRNYYEDHWRRMKGQNTDAWFTYKLPVIMALSASNSPMPIALIAKTAKLREAQVAEVIDEWRQFLNREDVVISNQTIPHYRFYHLSFIDFLHHKEQVPAEQVNFDRARSDILDHFIQSIEDELDD